MEKLITGVVVASQVLGKRKTLGTHISPHFVIHYLSLSSTDLSLHFANEDAPQDINVE